MNNSPQYARYVLAGILTVACSGSDGGSSGDDTQISMGGTAQALGGSPGQGGSSTSSTGFGGATSLGGLGNSGIGGTHSGGAASGGAASGGAASGGAASGGAASGGAASGGAASGGAASGGAASGGASLGGATQGAGGTSSGGTAALGGTGAGGANAGGAGTVAVGGAAGSGVGGTEPLGGATGEGGGLGVVGDLSLPVSPYIVVDQFGYLPDTEKLAVIRDPETGYDASESFAPGSTYALVNAATGERVFGAAPTVWGSGATDPSSGDRIWWFTFSAVTTPGEYFVLDLDRRVRSYAFTISDQAYREVLKRAVRMLYYQRAGQTKTAEHAGQGWTDQASFVGPGQDHECRLFSDMNNAATERDLWGGWYDAGDLNKYTTWTAGYVQTLLRAYAENPAIWRDDYEIPESGNGTPDVLDEALWGLDYLTRLQQDDGSMLSIVGEPGASPPSSATDPCRYGPATTSASFASAATFAIASRVLRLAGIAALDTVADDALGRAERAYAWAVANPSVTFRNNEGTAVGLGAGQQETDDYGRLVHRLDAAGQLFSVTGADEYRSFFDANYAQLNLIAAGNAVEPWHILGQDAALDYANAAGATPATVAAIHDAYLTGIRGGSNLGALPGDPYRAYIPAYVWGSNTIKAHMGNNFYNVVTYDLDESANQEMQRAAAPYLQYLHGTNPFSLVYLTNMYEYGAENSVNEIFHSWFANGSPLWDRVGESTYGPPPGFLSGGPNAYYECGDTSAPECAPDRVSPPLGQPPQKSYKDFNAVWPEGSWSISEPSNGYQVAYIRLLSKFVR